MSAPSTIDTRQNELFSHRLSMQLNPHHPIMILSHQVDWFWLEEALGGYFPSEQGAPCLPIRLMAGLMMLQHMEGLSDEAVVAMWVENPYWQYFCGYDHLQWEFPCDPSSMTRWRKRLGTEGVEKILSATIRTSVRMEHSRPSDHQQVIADTTVMEKAVAHPTDSALLSKAHGMLVLEAKQAGVVLRQSYTRKVLEALRKAARYGHAGQFKRMSKEVKVLKQYLGRVVRDVERKVVDWSQAEGLQRCIAQSKRLLAQEKGSKDKLYSLHAPEVECIGKGKAHKRYEFGCKVSVVVTHKQGLALSVRALHGNPYDGHTLSEALLESERLSGSTITRVCVDRGYKGHGITDKEVLMARQKGLPRRLRRVLKRRNAIEPHIGHMKQDGKLGRNHLKGILGDQLNALLSGVGHNMRLLRVFMPLFGEWIVLLLRLNQPKAAS